MKLKAPARPTMDLLILVAFVFTAAGCGNIQIRMGRTPNVEPLENTLRLGASTPADVILALGQPYGKGRVMFPTDPQPRTMWTYYYGEGDMRDGRGMYLFVFFDQDRYNGYMWFSSLTSQTSPEISKEKM